TTETSLSASIGDYVWNDADNDGVQDSNEVGIADIKVYIDSNDSDSVVYEWTCTVTAGASPGSITFQADGSGNAGVVFNTATSNSVLLTPQLTFDATINDPAEVGVVENTALLSAGEALYPVPSNTTETSLSASIGDYVWNDADNDGVQDSNEVGIADIKVYIDSNDNGVWDIGEPYDLTDALGGYRIYDLSSGTYTVRTDPSSYPDGFAPSTPPSLSVNLATGQTAYDDADFGLYDSPGTGTIGDTLWLDADNDGLIDAGEEKLSGIGIVLEINIGGIWYPAGHTTTATDGTYLFDELVAGDYRVTVDSTSQVTSPYSSGTYDLGAAMVPTYDLDGTGTAHIALVTLATDSTVINTLDFGYNWGGSIGDFVWYDNDADGLQFETECSGAPCGAPSSTVVLYHDVNSNGVIDPGEPPLGIYATGVDPADPNEGYYLFENLPPGSYMVAASEQEVPSPTTGQVGTMVHTGGEYRSVTLSGNENRSDVDFGMVEASVIEGNVFADENHDGVLAASETDLSNVTVTLKDSSGTVIATTTTDTDGKYKFIAPPGDYSISFDYDDTDIPAAIRGIDAVTTQASYDLTVVAGIEYSGY
ncbi:MAG: hypothetical protein D3924_17080, partial [Candidatus Electrothrix sp. AR4]|nr:hypothetical protein [Candidatus Electrothrix sp. AR4]